MTNRLVKRDTPHTFDDRLMREPDTKLQTPPDHRLRRERLLSEHHWMPWICRDNRGTNFDIRNVLCCHCNCSQRIHPKDLRHPKTRKALLSGFTQAGL